MWYLKILSGPQAGTTFNLKSGTNIVGRSTSCDVCIPSQSISKQHVKIEVFNDRAVVTDMNSRNGTFVNGVQIQTQSISPKDKITLFDIVFEVSNQAAKSKGQSVSLVRDSAPQMNYASDGNAAYQQNPQQPAPEQQQQMDANFLTHLQKYLDQVVLPGAYKLLEWMDFRWVLGAFVIGFIVLVTSLSTIPLIQILKSSVEQESVSRSLTIARTIATLARPHLLQGLPSAISTDFAQRESGVKEVYVIDGSSGRTIAPSNKVGDMLTHLPFVSATRPLGVEKAEPIDDSTIVALTPIKFLNASTGQETVAAYSVVVYDMGALAVGSGKTLSLFIQVLCIAIVLGGILLFFLLKIVEQPLVDLNLQMQGLFNGSGQLQPKYLYPAVSSLMTNITGLVSRGSGGFSGQQMQNYEMDRSQEISGILTLIGFPAMAIHPANRTIAGTNELLNSQIAQNAIWLGTKIDDLLDQALKLNMQSLLEKIVANPTSQATDQLEIMSNIYDLTAQGVFGSKDLAYVVIVFVQRSGG